ncbi:MAG TPA: 4Fe-4S binding protein [Thermoanaerobacterales bacterium]|nr:4Fe-4S binding protein [Thermoanaerobacterales bacterium]
MEKVVFDIERCKGCELCTTVCPRGIVIIDKSLINSQGFHPATVIEQDKCTSCGSCARICPDLVITVFKYD